MNRYLHPTTHKLCVENNKRSGVSTQPRRQILSTMSKNNYLQTAKTNARPCLFLAAAAAAMLAINPVQGQSADADWKATTISPVANPIYFEDPQIDSEVRPYRKSA